MYMQQRDLWKTGNEMTIEQLVELQQFMDSQPTPFYQCKVCGKDFLVFSEVPEGGYIICEDCS